MTLAGNEPGKESVPTAFQGSADGVTRLFVFNNPGEPLQTRMYMIKPESFVRNLKQLAPPKSGESNQDLLVRYFKENGIDTQKPRKVVLGEKNDWVFVRAVKREQDEKIEELISKINSEGPQ